jgi:hypothetical protein
MDINAVPISISIYRTVCTVGVGSLSQKRLFLAVLADLIAPLQILAQVDDACALC